MKCNDFTGRWSSDWMCRLRISRAVSNCSVTSFYREALERLLLAIIFCITVLIIQLFIWTRFCLFMMSEEHWHRIYGSEKVLLTSYEKRLAIGMMFPSLLIHISKLSSVSILSRPHIKRLVFDSVRRQGFFTLTARPDRVSNPLSHCVRTLEDPFLEGKAAGIWGYSLTSV